MNDGKPAARRTMPRQLAAALLAISVSCGATSFAAEHDGSSDRRLAPVGKWLVDRGPSDPRPYADVFLRDGLLGQGYFDFKNGLWLEDGISFGGYVSANSQWGSEDSASHSISESLFLFAWEPLRNSKSAGRLVAGLAHDRTFGRTTTREFADNQGLVETPNDLDTDPALTFTTLGLLHWE
jgi:hypothetical protein